MSWTVCGRTVCCYSSCFKCSGVRFHVWTVLVAIVWCAVMCPVVSSGVGFGAWSKNNADYQALLRKHQSYQRHLSTPSVLHRRNGELNHRTSTSPPSRSPVPVSRETEFNHLNSLLKSAKNFDSLAQVRRQLQNSNPWSSLYSSDIVHTSVKFVQPTSSDLQSRVLKPEPELQLVKSEKRVPTNVAVDFPATKKISVVDLPTTKKVAVVDLPTTKKPTNVDLPTPNQLPVVDLPAPKNLPVVDLPTSKKVPVVDHPTTKKVPDPSPSAVTSAKEFYKEMYSTEDGLRQIKEEYGPNNLKQAKVNYKIEQELEDVRLANEHFIQMRNKVRCHVPIPEVVCVKDVHIEAGKEYLPRCTLLHRCGHRSGCCDSEEFQCVPRVIQEVALNFYTVHLDYKPGEIPPENTVEKLLFDNHTECECAHSTEVPKMSSPSKSRSSTFPGVTESLPPPSTTASPHAHQSDDHSHRHSDHKGDNNNHQKCGTCPSPFHHREYQDGRCGCDCFDKERPCIRIKRGKETLPDPERRCVEVARCHIPECEYGRYETDVGRCPKRPDDYDKNSKGNKHHKPSSNDHHRWTFYERD